MGVFRLGEKSNGDGEQRLSRMGVFRCPSPSPDGWICPVVVYTLHGDGELRNRHVIVSLCASPTSDPTSLGSSIVRLQESPATTNLLPPFLSFCSPATPFFSPLDVPAS